MWSLGVEEQFYLAWPILLAIILWGARSRRLLTIGMIAAVTATSFFFCLRELQTDPKAAFYLPYYRAWELGVGALIVFVPAIRSRVLAEATGLIGALLIVVGLFTVRQTDLFPGTNAIAPVLGSALLIWPRSKSSIGSVLATAPMRFIGLISYSVYLWHWPIIVLFRHWANSAALTGAEAVVLATVSIVLGWASWRFVEQPFRQKRRPTVSIPSGLAAAVVVATIGGSVYIHNGFEHRTGSNVLAMSGLEVMWQWPCPRTRRLAELDRAYCEFGAPWEEASVKAIVWGDSHAEHIAPIIESSVEGRNASFLLYLECPAALGARAFRIWKEVPGYVQRCTEMRRRAILALADDPTINLVILSASWSSLGNVVSQDGSIKAAGGPYDVIAAELRSLIEETARPGRRFILVADVPQLHSDPIPCATAKYSGLVRRACQSEVTVSTKSFEAFQGRIYTLFSALAADREDTDVVLPGRALCSGEWCETELNGEFLYRDASHIRRNMSHETRRLFAEKIGMSAVLNSSMTRVTGSQIQPPPL